MGIFGGFPQPKGLPTPPPAAHPPTLASTSVALAGNNAKTAGAAAEGAGKSGTVKTSPQGDLQNPATAKATLLGQ